MCERLGVPPQRCLYVGDGDGQELTGAKRMGMDAVLICAPHEERIVMASQEARNWRGPKIAHIEELLTLILDPGRGGGSPDAAIDGPSESLADMAAADLDGCVRVFVQTFNIPPWNEQWTVDVACRRLAEIVNAPGFEGALIREGPEIVGFVAGVRTSWCRGDRFHVQEMCVLPTRQRQGLGTRLMRYLLARLAREGVGGLHLLTARDSQAAAFYARLGFRVKESMVMMTRPCGPDDKEQASELD
jgi:ribosomal protein S18 acetylase RimI-like enzyme